ncbi:hypothetical protein NEPAR06_0223 [Nematocida parisii]|uniref:RING-type domain-containing protein n=1 Tax=Nematocida parisii (strain ERTm3) TaxID=935791 RepID=I3EDA8_NEMP3|nr:uncharacterized protein NEPG_00621 [Nematocida parisii ERTm1]EIJ87205.1 hypothetical protein NEQG_02540 [Nematocida parisii ERTm3]KAI5126590.1 hypothetical protein NEPAR08_0509 [Nematocida parisii]EIJ95096.1 hypothetical protein NEPG_00621 [Nematocida parisii ERTm1]KAI5127873.1 hypothetical protein NEPAR03_1153 [Nematocida parisii]KAI5143188.1 hypothetical protein NEPAR07_0550 [Nematocida parisii]|eukprot:XP_013058452.1 hypothetical protein NEPG_00621 [Nematocida parisii ERTm1]
MYFLLRAGVLFFQILTAKAVSIEGLVGEKIMVAVQMERMVKDGKMLITRKEYSAYCNTNTLCFINKTSTKKAISISSNSIEYMLTCLFEEKTQIKPPLILHEDSSEQENGINLINIAKKDSKYNRELKNFMIDLKNNSLLLTSYDSTIKDAISFLEAIKYNGFLVVVCTTTSQINCLLSMCNSLIKGPRVIGLQASEDLLYFKTISNPIISHIMGQFAPTIYIEISPKPGFQDTIAPFAALVLISIMTVAIGGLYLFISRHIVRRPAPKTVASQDLQMIPTMLYISIPPSDPPAPQDCVICFEQFLPASNCRLLPCNHIYHVECIDTWLKQYSNRCPYCQSLVKNGDYMHPDYRIQ